MSAARPSDPGIVLEAARMAVRDGDADKALERYEWFFDHALDDDPHAYYGVRLSYCLGEWLALAESHPPAFERLHARRELSLRLFHETRDPERFHDYAAISQALDGDASLPLRVFTTLHDADPLLAAAVRRFIWHEIVAAELWKVAASYVTDPAAEYEDAVAKFDETLRVCQENPELGGDRFTEQIRGWCVDDLRDLRLVLQNSERAAEAGALRERALADARLAAHPEVARRAFDDPQSFS